VEKKRKFRKEGIKWLRIQLNWNGNKNFRGMGGGGLLNGESNGGVLIRQEVMEKMQTGQEHG